MTTTIMLMMTTMTMINSKNGDVCRYEGGQPPFISQRESPRSFLCALVMIIMAIIVMMMAIFDVNPLLSPHWWWENVRTQPKLGRFREIHPLCPRDFPQPSSVGDGFPNTSLFLVRHGYNPHRSSCQSTLTSAGRHLQISQAESQKRRRRVGIADRKVFARPESFCAYLQNHT